MSPEWFLAPMNHSAIRKCHGQHRDAGMTIGYDFAGQFVYGYRHCRDCSYARNLADEELAQFTIGDKPLRRQESA